MDPVCATVIFSLCLPADISVAQYNSNGWWARGTGDGFELWLNAGFDTPTFAPRGPFQACDGGACVIYDRICTSAVSCEYVLGQPGGSSAGFSISIDARNRAAYRRAEGSIRIMTGNKAAVPLAKLSRRSWRKLEDWEKPPPE